MDIAIYVAIAQNGVIGREGGLPWRLSSDLKRFKADTMGKPIIMGRKTWESLKAKLLEERVSGDDKLPVWRYVTYPRVLISFSAWRVWGF